MRVTGVSGSVEQNQGIIERNLRGASDESRARDGQRQMRGALELPPIGKHGELPLPAVDERLRQELAVWTSKELLRHQLAIRRLAFERLAHGKG